MSRAAQAGLRPALYIYMKPFRCPTNARLHTNKRCAPGPFTKVTILFSVYSLRSVGSPPRRLLDAARFDFPTSISLANACQPGSVPLAMKLPRTLAFMSLFSLLFGFARAEPLKIGDKAPQVSATTDAGTTLNLGDVYKQNDYTLVWFYPKALTSGCTKQGCSLRDATAELKQKGVAVVGVSTDPVEKQKEFKEKNNFPFPLLADTDKKVIKAFGQAGVLPVASREAYLIDRQGRVVYHDEKQTEQQAEKVLAYLNSRKG